MAANFEMDLKRVIALSTLSQLGFIIMGVGIGVPELAYFHIITHALFKSLLFLCAGIYIHGSFDSQGMRFLGGLIKSSPLTSYYFIVSSLSLIGFPFLSGFYSKDMLLLSLFPLGVDWFILVMVIAGVVFTIMYSVRLAVWSFITGFKGSVFKSLVEDFFMLIPMGLLFLISVLGGSLVGWVLLNPSLLFLGINLGLMIFILMIFFVCLVISFIYIGKGESQSSLFGRFVRIIWGLTSLTTLLFIPVFRKGVLYFKELDHGWMELLGGQGFYLLFFGSGG